MEKGGAPTYPPTHPPTHLWAGGIREAIITSNRAGPGSKGKCFGNPGGPRDGSASSWLLREAGGIRIGLGRMGSWAGEPRPLWEFP